MIVTHDRNDVLSNKESQFLHNQITIKLNFVVNFRDESLLQKYCTPIWYGFGCDEREGGDHFDTIHNPMERQFFKDNAARFKIIFVYILKKNGIKPS